MMSGLFLASLLRLSIFSCFLRFGESVQNNRRGSSKVCFELCAKPSRPSQLGQQRALSEKAMKYIQMRELQKLKSEGGSYDDVKSFVVNGTKSSLTVDSSLPKKGYQKYVGKGSLDQRLRAVVAYKRSNIAAESLLKPDSSGELTMDEERELDAMMESDEFDDEDLLEDDEEAIYEGLVMKIIEESKLEELKRNFVLDKQAVNDARDEEKEKEKAEAEAEAEASTADTSSNISDDGDDVEFKKFNPFTNPKGPAGKGARAITKEEMDQMDAQITAQRLEDEKAQQAKDEEDDMYTPSRSSWGVFKRPRDISKKFGGGRVITKAEMDRMDEEVALRNKEAETQKRVYVTESQRLENENEGKIRDALSRSRGYMDMGNRKMAVQVLEAVQDFCCWHTDFGGEVLLELGMALETVDRADDARQVYGKLVAISWNSKTRRNALALIQGLDITKKIRKTTNGAMISKPAMDYASMQQISEALKQGLTNEWDEYSKKDSVIAPWYGDDEDDAVKARAREKVESFRDAYFLLLRLTNPLKKVSSEAIIRAVRKMYLVNDEEKLTFLRNKGLIVGDTAIAPSLGNEKKKKVYVSDSDAALESFIPGMNFRINNEFLGNTGTVAAGNIEQPVATAVMKAVAPEKVVVSSLMRGAIRDPVVASSYEKSMNGTWDLLVSLADTQPYTAKRYESGMMRRIVDMPNESCIEVVPVMWGLSTARQWSELKWNAQRTEALMSGPQVVQSQAPWQTKNKDQTFQVVYCDDNILVSRQPSKKVTEPDLYSVWKRVLPTVWKKY